MSEVADDYKTHTHSLFKKKIKLNLFKKQPTQWQE